MPLPYPVPTSLAASRVMRANRRANTRPELRLRSELHRRGYRFRIGIPVHAGDVRVVPDIVFPRRRLAVFVDGCFWHRCPIHGVRPVQNTHYWEEKLDRNVERDERVCAALLADGWAVVRIWEHESPRDGADRVTSVVETHDSR